MAHPIKPTHYTSTNGKYATVTWAGLGDGDIGDPVAWSPGCSFQVEGEFPFGAECAIEGSIDGVNFHSLTDAMGIHLMFNAAGIGTPSEPVLRVRPHVASPKPVSITVTALFTRS